VGYAESTSEGSDLLLRAVADAYACWLSQASSLAKLNSLVKQAKQQPGSVVAGFLNGLAAIVGDALSLPGVGAVEKVLSGVLSVSDNLKTGGLHLSTLSYDQAKELLVRLSELAPEYPLVLILDRLDGCRPVEQAVAPLALFCDHLDGWPQIHFFLGVRRGPEEAQREAVSCVQALRSRSPVVKIMELGRMDLRDPSEQEGLLDCLARMVPVTQHLEPTEVLHLMDGHAGVFARWRDASSESLDTFAALRSLAADAQAYRYEELGAAFQAKAKASPLALRLLLRLALLPQLHDDVLWAALGPLVLDGIPADTVGDLVAERVVQQQGSYLTYGHLTRYEAARYYCTRDNNHSDLDLRPYVRQEIEWLITQASRRIRTVDWVEAPFALALANLLPLDDSILGDEVCAVCLSAASLFSSAQLGERKLRLAKALAAAGRFREAVGLLAMGLFNTLVGAKAEEDLPRRDALLEELRALATAYPEDAAVREPLAKGLFNTLNDAKAEEDLPRRDALLEELRALASAYPEDAAVRERLAKGLFNTLNDAKAEEDLPRRDALLEELRALATAYPEDAAVQAIWRLTLGLEGEE
jgi:hypothetical protein